jgi:hypothetical protein
MATVALNTTMKIQSALSGGAGTYSTSTNECAFISIISGGGTVGGISVVSGTSQVVYLGPSSSVTTTGTVFVTGVVFKNSP